VPSNPLLQTVDLERVAAATRGCGGLSVADDSMGAFFNLDLLRHADIVLASLTKYFCGRGDVMAGGLVVNPDSPYASELLQFVQDEEDLLFAADAEALVERAADFSERMQRVNNTTARLVETLGTRDDVTAVFYPHGQSYEALRRGEGGYGGVFSLLLATEEAAARFYDRLAVAKGPSFGMHVTLACPYTLLAHYHELDWAESCGVAKHLVRVSVGLESFERLRATFERALTE
jgi:cystathionine gamma-synthase